MRERLQKWWMFGSDGSLNPRSSYHESYEIRSQVISGEFSSEVIRETCKSLTEHGAYVTRTCGLHVHFSFASKLNIDPSKRLAFMRKLEAGVAKFKPWSERLNYCMPLHKHDRYVEKRDNGYAAGKYHVVRYCGRQSRYGLPQPLTETADREEILCLSEQHFEARVFNGTLKPRGIMVAVGAVVNAAAAAVAAENNGEFLFQLSADPVLTN